MTKAILFYRNSHLTKLFMLVMLLVGWGNFLWADDVYFNATADIIGWTKSSINYRSWNDKNLYINGTGGTLTSNNNISFSKGDTFVITAKGYNATSTTPPQIIVKKSSDNGGSWSDVITFSYSKGDINLSNGEYKDLVVTGLDGDYKIQLKCDYILISCIKKVTSSLPILSISPSGRAEFGNVTSDASKKYTITNNTGSTVNITPTISGSNADMFSVTLDDENVKDKGVEITDGDSKDFYIEFDWQADAAKMGDKSATISFTPDNGDDPFEISAIATAKAILELDENKTPSLTTGSKASLLLKYSVQSGWNTICMPFVLYNSSLEINRMNTIFGTGWKAYTLNNYNNGTIRVAQISNSAIINSNTPYLVYIASAPSNPSGIVFTDVYTYSTAAGSSSSNGASFQGTYSTKTYNALTDEENPWYGVTPAGKVMKAGSGASVKGYRAYFTGISAPADGARISIVIDEGEGETTDLGFVKLVDENAKDIYTLSGQKVQKGRKGIYIVNGRKVVIK